MKPAGSIWAGGPPLEILLMNSSSGVGFQGSGAAAKPEEYAAHLLELYGKCMQAVAGKSR